MKRLLVTLLIFQALQPFAQNSMLPDNFKIGNYVEVFSKDSIRIYFNCTGTVHEKKCASFYRIGKIDSTIINVVGEFFDYFPNGSLAFKATMKKNQLQDSATYFYQNGKIKEEGQYQNNIRIGKWTYYYSNGKVSHIYNFENGKPTVLEAFSSNGRQTVSNGNGSFVAEFSNAMQCSVLIAKGNLLNGKKTGKWSFGNPDATPVAIEEYVEDEFVKGTSNNYEYTSNPKISFTNFYANENLLLTQNYLGCPGESVSLFGYKEKGLTSIFYPEIIEQLKQYKQPVKNQWLIVGIDIGKKGNIAGINIASSINDTLLENYLYSIIQKTKGWEMPRRNSQKVNAELFFTIFIDNNEVIIPELYLSQN